MRQRSGRRSFFEFFFEEQTDNWGNSQVESIHLIEIKVLGILTLFLKLLFFCCLICKWKSLVNCTRFLDLNCFLIWDIFVHHTFFNIILWEPFSTRMIICGLLLLTENIFKSESRNLHKEISWLVLRQCAQLVFYDSIFKCVKILDIYCTELGVLYLGRHQIKFYICDFLWKTKTEI